MDRDGTIVFSYCLQCGAEYYPDKKAGHQPHSPSYYQRQTERKQITQQRNRTIAGMIKAGIRPSRVAKLYGLKSSTIKRIPYLVESAAAEGIL